MNLKCGDTFLLPKSANATEHLWIIVTEVDPNTGTAICVNVTSKRDDSEATVVLNAGDHRFIKHQSVVRFSDAREMKIELVEKLLSSRPTQFVGTLHSHCSEQLLARIRQGLLDSPMTPKEIKQKCQMLWSS